MSHAKSYPDENAGRCEGCNREETVYQTQVTIPVLLGGGIGWGTMYLCPKCLAEHQEREALRAYDGCAL